eukprot:83304_1
MTIVKAIPFLLEFSNSMTSSCSTVCLLSNVIFPALDFSVGAALIFYGILAYNTTTFEDILLPIHVGIMGVIVIILTFYIPKVLGVQIPFYLTFTGRGFVFLFFGGFVLDPGQYTYYGSFIGIGIILVAFLYFLIAILNVFQIIVVVLPPPIIQNDCKATVTIALAKQKMPTHKTQTQTQYARMDDHDNDYFDDTI